MLHFSPMAMGDKQRWRHSAHLDCVVLPPLLVCCLIFLSAIGSARGELFENLRALSNRSPVGDPLVLAAEKNEGPKGITSGDFNGDGKNDLATSNLDGTVTQLFYGDSGQWRLAAGD